MPDTHGTALDHRFVVRSSEPLAEVVRETLAPLATGRPPRRRPN